MFDPVRLGMVVGAVLRGFVIAHEIGDPFHHEVEIVGAHDRHVEGRKRSQPSDRRQCGFERWQDLRAAAGEEAVDETAADVE